MWVAMKDFVTVDGTNIKKGTKITWDEMSDFDEKDKIYFTKLNERVMSSSDDMQNKSDDLEKRKGLMTILLLIICQFAFSQHYDNCERSIGIVYTMSGGASQNGPAMNLELVAWHVPSGIIGGFGVGSYPAIEVTKNHDEAVLSPYIVAGYRFYDSQKYKMVGTAKVNAKKTTTFSARLYRLVNENLMVGIEPFYQDKNSGALAVITMRFN